MFRIGEFSKLTQVSIRMLRYYDETGLLKPAQIDKYTGYRLYSVDQIPILHRIVFLRDSGFQVAEITEVLKNWNEAFIISELKNKQEEIKSIIKVEQERCAKINTAIRDMGKERIAIHCNVTLRRIPGYPVLALRKIIPDYFSEGALWKELDRKIEEEHIRLPQNTLNFAIYHDLDYKESAVDVEVCTVIPEPTAFRDSELYRETEAFRDSELYRETEAVETMACFMVYGSFENIGPAFISFAHWLTDNDQYEMAGLSRQIVHRGPWNEEDPGKWLTEIQIPVEILK